FQIGLRGFRPVLIDSLPYAGGQCAALYPDAAIHDAPGLPAVPAGELTARLRDQLEPFSPIYLFGRRAASVWGSVENGFSVETNTGETATGVAVIYAGGPGALRPRRIEAEGIESLGGGDLAYDPAAPAKGRRVAVVGDGPSAVDAALAASNDAAAVTLVHAAPLTARADRLSALDAAATRRRLQLVEGEVERLEAPGGRLSGVAIRSNEGVVRHDVDLLLVQAGLELVEGGITGLGPVADPTSGETATPGIFIVGDAAGEAPGGQGRPPVIAAGFSEAVRAAEGVAKRIAAPAAGRTLPHTASSPVLQARLKIA
ncbi:MAG: NAD(P)-binding domain-containing protein, partial [Pseudomonadota bacterium]